MADEIHTEIDIEASIERAWAVLSDFAAYPSWNPRMQIKGELEVGSPLEVSMKLEEDGDGMTFRPVLQAVEPGVAFRWKGNLIADLFFTGLHSFELSTHDGHTRFVHREVFGGVFSAPILWMIRKKTVGSFEAFNEALKRRCETPPASSPSSA